jgi:tetratricopeptide (TPR) repeat protein
MKVGQPMEIAGTFIVALFFLTCTTSLGFAGPRENAVTDAAWQAMEKGMLDDGICLFSQVLQSDSITNIERASALNGRGIAYRQKGLHDSAIADYIRAIGLNPDFGDAYSNRGLAYAKTDRWDAAVVDFTEAARREPGNAMTYLKRGNAYFDKGDIHTAIDDWSRAIILNPGIMRAYYNRCDAYDRIGRRDLAIEDCKKVLELDAGFLPARKALEWLESPRTGNRPCFCNQ